jgi:hypothetical protein
MTTMCPIWLSGSAARALDVNAAAPDASASAATTRIPLARAMTGGYDL